MPRSEAQRAFPSMMIATYRAATAPPAVEEVSGLPGRLSNLQDLLLLGRERGVDLAGPRVGQLRPLRRGARPLVASDVASLLELAKVVHHVAADVANRDAPLLGDP